MTLPNLFPARQRLSTKIVALLIGFLLLALGAIGYTLLLSWQMEGAAGAINDAGSLRMRSYRLAMVLSERTAGNTAAEALAREQVAQLDDTFAALKRGDPVRPLFLPRDAEVQLAFAQAVARWRRDIRPQALQLAARPDPAAWQAWRGKVDGFVRELNELVGLMEHVNATRTFLLRGSQLLLIGMALFGTIVLIYMLFLMIVLPVERLRSGIARMAAQDFGVRLAVESRDEFGELSDGFNHMADRVQNLYQTLETRVKQKTAALAEHNRELALLYEIAAFLNEAQSVDALCTGFLDRLIHHFDADGGTVRVLDPQRRNAHMVVARGLPDALVEQEHCLKVGECLCGDAVASDRNAIHHLDHHPNPSDLDCHRAGFGTVSLFHVRVHQQSIGFFNLHFRTARILTRAQVELLETLGRHLGVAIENQRLAATEREMAVSEERNLVAQGLHDSIAQGINFLNLQVQLLQDSIRRGAWDEASDTLPMLQAGVKESYEDVRELLNNFRSRVNEGTLKRNLVTTLERFRRQTGLAVDWQADGDGPPLPPEQQLQVLFILQEALSNVRKHAGAAHVRVALDDRHDLKLTVQDDGAGFDPAATPDDSHVGLAIMRERAQRIHAQLDVDSAPGTGTTVTLWLPRDVRMAA